MCLAIYLEQCAYLYTYDSYEYYLPHYFNQRFTLSVSYLKHRQGDEVLFFVTAKLIIFSVNKHTVFH
jgi:hypothetical protein